MSSRQRNYSNTKLTREVRHAFDLRPAVVLFQAGSILLCSVAGMLVGCVAHGISVCSGAAVGVVVGIIVATFLTSAVPKLRPRLKKQFLSLDRYRQIHRRYKSVGWSCIVWAGVGLVCLIRHIAAPDRQPARGAWILWWLLPMLLGYALLILYSERLNKWRCPECGHLFHRRGVCSRYPHVCAHCTFAIEKADADDPNGKKTRGRGGS